MSETDTRRLLWGMNYAEEFLRDMGMLTDSGRLCLSGAYFHDPVVAMVAAVGAVSKLQLPGDEAMAAVWRALPMFAQRIGVSCDLNQAGRDFFTLMAETQSDPWTVIQGLFDGAAVYHESGDDPDDLRRAVSELCVELCGHLRQNSRIDGDAVRRLDVSSWLEQVVREGTAAAFGGHVATRLGSPEGYAACQHAAVTLVRALGYARALAGAVAVEDHLFNAHRLDWQAGSDGGGLLERLLAGGESVVMLSSSAALRGLAEDLFGDSMNARGLRAQEFFASYVGEVYSRLIPTELAS